MCTTFDADGCSGDQSSGVVGEGVPGAGFQGDQVAGVGLADESLVVNCAGGSGAVYNPVYGNNSAFL